MYGLHKIICFALAPETAPRNTLFQKAAIQEGPRRFREGKREGRNGPETVFDKKLQSSKVREGSGKGNGKVETDLPKSCNPGRSGKVPGRVTGRGNVYCELRFYPFFDEVHWFARDHLVETDTLRAYLVAVSGPVSGPFKKPAIQQGPGRFREDLREAKKIVKGQRQE